MMIFRGLVAVATWLGFGSKVGKTCQTDEAIDCLDPRQTREPEIQQDVWNDAIRGQAFIDAVYRGDTKTAREVVRAIIEERNGVNA